MDDNNNIEEIKAEEVTEAENTADDAVVSEAEVVEAADNADTAIEVGDPTVSAESAPVSEDKPKEKKGAVANIFEIVEMFAACAAVILLVFTFVVRLTVVDGPSMNKTLTNGDYVVVESLGYTPKRGDIVVVQDPTANGYTKPLIKRLIAVGGDTVDIDFSTWTVTVNGEVLDESAYVYIDPSAVFTSDYKFPVTIEEGKVFVMGDNRHHSADSRLSTIGQIDERCVVGHAFMRILPFDSIKVFD